MDPIDTRDRVIAMEVKIQHLINLVESQNKAIQANEEKVQALYALFNEAKGIRRLSLLIFAAIMAIPALITNWGSVMSLFTK